MTATTTQTVQPDIQYAPNREKYENRSKLRLQGEELAKSLPPGFPSKLTGDLVWEGSDVAGRYDWVYALNSEELEEVEAALNHFKCASTIRKVLT